jgi:hypothetical protein
VYNFSTAKDSTVIIGDFSGYVMESYYSARKIADMHLMHGRANGNSWEAHCFSVEHVNFTESHPTNLLNFNNF